MKRICCCLTAAFFVLCASSCGRTTPAEPRATGESEDARTPTYTAFPGRLEKREAVFASLASDGTVQSVTVTDRLVTDVPHVQVHDVSTLRDVHAVTDTQTPQTDGVSLTWQMSSTQLYYSGTTDKSLPVSLSIRYFLDGRETTRDALRGRAGRVRVLVRAVAQTQGNYVPFLLAGGMILDGGETQITAENGGFVGDGSRDLVYGVLLPGLADALGIADSVPLPEQFSVEFDTKSCRIGSLYFAMLPLSTARLGEAVQSLFGAQDVPQLDLSPLLEEIRQVGNDDSIAQFLRDTAGSAALFQAAQQAMQAYGREQPLLDVLQRYLTPENAELLQQTVDSLSGTSLQSYASLLREPAFVALLTDMGTVSEAFVQLIPQITAMINDLQSEEVRTAIVALPDTMQKLQALTNALEANADALDALAAFSRSGGLSRLETLLRSVQSVIDSGALETLQSLSGRAEQIEQRLQTVLASGKAYGIFTAAPKDAETSVYFVLKVG